MARRPDYPSKFIDELLEFLDSDNWWCVRQSPSDYATMDEYYEAPIEEKRDPDVERDGGGWPGHAEEFLVGPIRKMICNHYGHNLVQDYCGIPKHDYCRSCMIRREALDGP